MISGNYLGEDGSPDGLNVLDLGGRQDSLELVALLNQAENVSPNSRLYPVHRRFLPKTPILQTQLLCRCKLTWTKGVDTYGDLNAIIGKDEGGVRASELSGRHGGRLID